MNETGDGACEGAVDSIRPDDMKLVSPRIRQRLEEDAVDNGEDDRGERDARTEHGDRGGGIPG